MNKTARFIEGNRLQEIEESITHRFGYKEKLGLIIPAPDCKFWTDVKSFIEKM